MTIRSLAFVSTIAVCLALAGSTFAAPQDEQHETHHPETTGEAATTSGASDLDERMEVICPL